MKPDRMRRVDEAVREVLSDAIATEIKDPRVGFVTVTSVDTAPDLRHAKVYVSVMGSEREQQLALHGLKHAAGFVQAKLAERLQTRFTPLVTFVLDPGVKNALAVSRLLQEEARAAAARQPGGEDTPPDQVKPGRPTPIP